MVTPEFVATYEHLTDEQAACVDAAIRRLLDSPRSAWARRSRVVGDNGAAWLVAVRCGDSILALYWRQESDGSIVLLLLLGV